MSANIMTLTEAYDYLGRKVSKTTLRREIRAGNLKVFRARASCNATILILEKELLRWIEEVASRRQLVPSPTEVAKARKLCGDDDA